MTSVDDVTSQNLLPHLKTSKDYKTKKLKKKFILWDVICKLIHLEFKIQEIFPRNLQILYTNLCECACIFNGFANLLGNISCTLNSGCINLYF